MNLNVVASVVGKDIATLNLSSLVLVSVAFGMVILAIILFFGVRIYMHGRKDPAHGLGGATEQATDLERSHKNAEAGVLFTELPGKIPAHASAEGS